MVVIGTAIADTFVVTENLVAGAGQIVNFVNIESVEVNGAGGDDQIYVLSTSERFELNVVGGSGDDTIHLGGDHPPLVFDPPEVQFTPPAMQVSLGETIKYETKHIGYGDYEFRFKFGWWTWWFGSAIEEFARQAVAHTVNGWFSKMKGNVPNMRNEQHSYDSITSRQEWKRRGWWWWWFPSWDREVIVTVKNLKLTYETGTLVEIQNSSTRHNYCQSSSICFQGSRR